MKIQSWVTRSRRAVLLCSVCALTLNVSRLARADLESDMARPTALLEQQKYADAAPLLDALALRYPEEFLVQFTRGIAWLGALDTKDTAQINIERSRQSRAALLRARKLAGTDREKLDALAEPLRVAEEVLKAYNVPLEAPPPAPANAKDAELAALKARIAELEAGKNSAPVAPPSPAPKPVAPKAKPVALKPLKPKPNFVIGRVTNELGQPLEDVEIGIYGTTMAGGNTRFEATTDAQGMFSQRVPEGIYGTTAYLKKRFNNQNYRFTLPPTDGITAQKHDSAPGIVKEFVWHISGLKPGETPGEKDGHNEVNKYFGASLNVSTRQEGFGGGRVYYPKGSILELTLTPRSLLIDGRPATVYVNRHTFDKDITSSQTWYPNDIPVGLYTLSARLLAPDGTSRALGVKKSGDINAPYTATMPLDFEPSQFGDLVPVQVTIDFESP